MLTLTGWLEGLSGPNFEQLMDRILIEEATSTSNCTDSVSAESVKTAMESFGSEEMDRMKKDITLWEKGEVGVCCV